MQSTKHGAVFKPRIWLLRLSVFHSLGTYKLHKKKSCAYCCVESFLFFGILVPQVMTNLGALDVPLQDCENAKALCCCFKFSLYALCCELENAWRAKLEGAEAAPLSVLPFSLGH